MKQIRTSHKIIALVALITMLFSLASCKKEGSLELKSFTVNRASIKTNYLVGEPVDFSGIQATAKYSDESLNKVYTYAELTLDYPSDITATPGEKVVTVSFQDPNLNKTQSTTFTVTVTSPASSEDNEYPVKALQFERPAGIVAFNSSNASAGSTKHGESGFASEFLLGGQTYVVGNENEFKLNPKFSYSNKGNPTVLLHFFTKVELSILKDDSYVALTATAGDGNLVSFYDGETLMATVNTFEGKYQFSADAENHGFRISVSLSEEHYSNHAEFKTITLDINVIKAYNVYEAWQLSVIDNDTSRDAWDEIKTANGIKDLSVSGAVLHNNIKITADDVPESFLLTSTKEVIYTNSVSGETKVVPAGTKYLDDGTDVYNRTGAGEFVFEGNFFTVDASTFPLVPSIDVFGKEADLDYGSDFSNATLFRFETVEDEESAKPDDVANVSISNLSIKGNSHRDNLLDAAGQLASAGGLIFVKSSNYTEMTVNNIIGNSFFIAYFPDCGGNLTANSVKCYDSYQNASMVWGYSTLTVRDSFFEGCGGPAIIAQSVTDDGWHPNTIVENTVLSTSLSGQEIWFTAVNATPVVSSIKALGVGLGQTGFGSFVDSNGMMNIQALLMASSSDAEAAASDVTAQGLMMVNGNGLNRYMSDELWMAILTHPALAQGAPFLSVIGQDGNAYVIFFNGTTFCDIYGNALGTDPSHAHYQAAFQASDTVLLTQGGLTVVFELYHE